MSALAVEPCRSRYFIYTRISRDSEGKELGVTRQSEDLEAFVEAQGGIIAGRYQDNDKSASKFATKPRPEFELMIKRAAAAGCDVIAAYTAGRITRRPAEFERLIELAERHGIRFEYISSPAFDLSTADGRMVARVLAAADAAEPDRTSERARRARKQRRNNGIIDPPASRCFGYAAGGYTVPEPAEALLIRSVFQLVANGYGAPEAGAFLIKHGAVGTDGLTQWQARKVHNLLRRATYAGLMQHSEGHLITATNVTPIVPVDVWRDAQATLDQRVMASRAPSRQWLLSGMVQCAECGSRMIAKAESRNGRGYINPAAWICKKEIGRSACGSVSRTMALIDAMVDAFVLARIEAASAITVSVLPSTGERAVTAELATLAGRLTDTRDLVIDGTLTPADGAAILSGLRDRIVALEGAQGRARALTARRRATVGVDAAAVWSDRSEDARPARRMIVEQYVSTVTVGKPVTGEGISRAQAAADSVTIIGA